MLLQITSHRPDLVALPPAPGSVEHVRTDAIHAYFSASFFFSSCCLQCLPAFKQVSLEEAAEGLPDEFGVLEGRFRSGFNDAYFDQLCSSKRVSYDVINEEKLREPYNAHDSTLVRTICQAVFLSRMNGEGINAERRVYGKISAKPFFFKTPFFIACAVCSACCGESRARNSSQRACCFLRVMRDKTVRKCRSHTAATYGARAWRALPSISNCIGRSRLMLSRK